jgi:hypothetical protein
VDALLHAQSPLLTELVRVTGLDAEAILVVTDELRDEGWVAVTDHDGSFQWVVLVVLPRGRGTMGARLRRLDRWRGGGPIALRSAHAGERERTVSATDGVDRADRALRHGDSFRSGASREATPTMP